VTEYLRQRFGREKITLMAHSWGSYIGIQAAARYPDLYTAYIGIGQISHQVESEQLAYAYALDFYKKAGDQKMVQKLEAAPPTLRHRQTNIIRKNNDQRIFHNRLRTLELLERPAG
jgi:pimeloyl-ACP methyl ester carboxylesterase